MPSRAKNFFFTFSLWTCSCQVGGGLESPVSMLADLWEMIERRSRHETKALCCTMAALCTLDD